MIPAFNASGVLPPFNPSSSPEIAGAMAPYNTTILEIVQHFSTSPERINILLGLIAYRKELTSVGIVNGFQWLDGSFFEDVELLRSRPPSDVDLITIAERPADFSEKEKWDEFISVNSHVFHPEETKDKFFCDAYYIDLHMNPYAIVNNVRYYFGLFSHQKETFLWKGLLAVPLDCDDSDALQYLEGLISDAS